MSLKPFNFGIVTKRVLPVKALRNSSAQQLELNKIIDLAIWGAKENLLEEISFADDDIMRWNPDAADDYKDKNSKLFARLAEIKAKLDAAGLPVHAVTCDLAANGAFAHGAFTNSDPKVRDLARKKAERALEIGKALNASLFFYESDADGFDSPFTVTWQDAWKRLAAGLDTISQYANAQKMTNFRGGCIVPRQSATYLYGYINTPSDALNIIQSLLKDRNFWGIVPATSQLAAQGWDKAPATLANLAGARRLAALKIGGGADKAGKRAAHPILGTGNLTETVQTLWLLDKMGWKGAVEYDNAASISDAKCNNDELTCKQFIANSANALTVALQIADKIKADALASLTPSEADLMAATIIGALDVDNVILRTIKNLPPAFETPQRPVQPAANQNQQRQNNQNQNNQNQQKQNNQQRQNNQNQQKQNGQQRQNNQNQQKQNSHQNQQPAPAAEPEAPAAVETTAQEPASAAEPAVQAPAAEPAVQAPAAEPAVQAPMPVAESVAELEKTVEDLHVDADPASFLHLKPKRAAVADEKPEVAEEAPAVEEPAAAPAEEQPAEPPAKPATKAKSRKTAPAPLPPPAPVTEDMTESEVDELMPIILPDEKPAKAKQPSRRKPAARKSTGTARRTSRKKTTDSSKQE